jgi:membrane dipeptidase
MKKSGTPSKLADLFIFDAHCDTASVLFDQPWSFRKSPAHLDLQKIRRGGLKAQVFAIWVDPLFAPQRALKKGLRVLRTMEEKVFALKLAAKTTTVKEMEEAVGKRHSPEILDVFYSLGIRGMTLTHFKNTDWADSSTDAPHAKGLTALGRQIVSRMEQKGMAIDLSHVSDLSARHVLQTVSVPVMASHSNARKLCPVPRNLPDDLIRAIAARQGFIGVNFFPAFIASRVFEQIEANFSHFTKEIKARTKGKLDDPEFLSQVEWEYYQRAVIGTDPVGLDRLIDHIVHIAATGGIDCVGLGSDFDGISSTPAGLANAAAYPALVTALQQRGFQEKEIRKICGLNLKNFWRRLEQKGGRQ